MKNALSSLALILWSIANAQAYVCTGSSTPDGLDKGKKLYTQNCATCHGDHGDGMGPSGKYMLPKPRSFAKEAFKKGDSVESIFTTVTQGLDGTAMAGFATLPDADRCEMARYVLTFRPKKK